MDKVILEKIDKLGREFSTATILMHEAIASKAGLTGTDHKYLGILLEKGEMTAGALSKLTGLTTGAITGVIDRLENKKLVKRRLDKGDRRKVLIVADQDKANKLLSETFKLMHSKIVSLLSEFDADEIKVIEKYLISATRILEEITKSLEGTSPIK